MECRNGQGSGRRRAQQTPISTLVEVYRRYLHLPDPSCLYALLGAVAANMIEGSPVWLMLVGGASSGKTALLESLLELPQVYELESPSGESSFLSGTRDKDKAKDATGGDLRRIGSHGAFVMQDFTSVLSNNGRQSERERDVLNVLRQCWNGRWSRSVGSDGGKPLSWEGKLAFFGGGTGAIEQIQGQMASLGERWMYWRMGADEVVLRANARKALERARGEGWKRELKDAVETVFESLELRFNGPDGEPGGGEGGVSRTRPLTSIEVNRTVLLGELAARCRSAIPRDQYTKEVTGAPDVEGPARISDALGQLLLGMELIGVGERERWGVLRKLAGDSVPGLRWRLLSEVRSKQGTGPGGLVTVRDLVTRTGCGFQTIRRVVEDLELLGMVEVRGVVELGLGLGAGSAAGVMTRGQALGRLGAGEDPDDTHAKGLGAKTTVRLTQRAKRDLERGWPV